jgi:HprK-related kinase A
MRAASLSGVHTILALGPYHVAIKLGFRELVPQFEHLYQGYTRLPNDAFADFTVGVRASGFWRQFIRADALGFCDTPAPFVPLPRESAMVALEMMLNWQCAMGSLRYLILHAGVVAKQDSAVLLPGLSGAGKTTLSIALGYRGWRYLADEYALIDLNQGDVHPFPRPASLKNQAIDVIARAIPSEMLSRRYPKTAKGVIAYARPPADALAAMARTATPRLIVFPVFSSDATPSVEQVLPAEALVLLINGSPNYLRLGARGFGAITRLVAQVPSYRMVYPSLAHAQEMLEDLMAQVPHGG